MKNFYFLLVRVPLLCALLFNFTLVSGQNKSIFSKINSVSNGLPTTVFDKNDPGKLSSWELVQQNQSLNISPIESMQGKPEDLAKRDAFSKHFKNADGSYMAVVASGPVHYQKNGQWEDIDTNINNSSYGSYAYANTANLLESYFGNSAQKGVMSKTPKGEVKEFLNTKMYWEVNGQKAGEIAGADVAAKIGGNQLFYNNLFGNISAEFTILTGKRKLNYIIPNKEALGKIPNNADYLVFSEDVVLPKGWTYKMTDKENVEIKDTDGKVSFIYSKPYVLENYKENEAPLPNRTNSCTFEVINNDNGFTFVVKVKASWLIAGERKFPIAVDPTVYPNNAIYWTGSVDQLGYGNDDLIYIGRDAGAEVDGWVRYNLSSIPDNQTINTVSSRLYFYGATGTINNQRAITIGDCITDPLTATYYIDIFNGYTQNISTSSAMTNNTVGFRTNNFNAQGVAYIQNSLTNDFATVIAWPSGIWGNTNYGVFYGYSAAVGQKPELVVNYYAAPTCIAPTSSANSYYVSNVKFLGTLIPDTTSANAGYNPTGYYYSPTNMATQIPGGVVNVYVSNNAVSNFTKAWVDWNQNGTFDSSERVYDSGNILIPNTIFGFVIPLGTALGTYKIRIRNYQDSPYFLACGPLSNGETEDYTFTVIADCPAKITAVNINPGDGKRCGAGAVVLSASGTGTAFQWYTSQFSNTPIPGETGSTYTTGFLPIGTTTFYVTAKNNSPCESVYRTPVKAVVSPTPTITFSQSSPDICGTSSSLSVSSSGDKEEITLFNEGFGSSLGLFTNQITGNANANAVWQQRSSPYVLTTPPYYALKPALSSGYNNGSFAMISTDVNQTSNILNNLVLTNNVNTTGFLNLKLDFDFFYYSMIDSDVTYGYLKVDYSINGGTAWTNLTTITTDQGSPSLWSNQSIALPAVCLNQPNFKIRFSVFAYGANNGWIADLASIDNVRLYGDKPLSTNFAWTGGAGSIYNSDCTTPYSGAATAVCIKPSALQIENDTDWNFTATATLSNGCSASGTITITNNTKTWNTIANNWGTNNWKPGGTGVPPIADKCVIIKTPVNILAGSDAFAKNVRVESTGKININADASLTVTDAFINQATEADVIIASDANLKQITDSPVPANSGSVTAKRNIKFRNDSREEYNYLISPVVGQSLKTIYPGVPTTATYPYVLYHNEVTNYFYNSSGAYIAGRGLAMKEPSKTDVAAATLDATFKGPLANGFISIPLTFTDNVTHGYNLVGNPYASNVDLQKLYVLNGGSVSPTAPATGKITSTFYFWDNGANDVYQQQGNGYSGRAYAVYNAYNDTGNKAGYLLDPNPANAIGVKRPNKVAKVGQGFMVRAQSTGNSLVFNNSIRISDNTGASFFSKVGDSIMNRYWLRLITPANLVNTIAVVHFEGGLDTFDMDDSELNVLSSDMFYSLAEDHKVQIEGRPAFVETDRILLGSAYFVSGNYTISLGDKEGIFANDQNIYLKDKQTGVITNLTEGDYTFGETAGENTGRFEIIYRPETVLVTDYKVKEAIIVYRDNDNFIIKSPKTMSEIQVYDASGKLITVLKPNDKQAVLNVSSIANGLYVLKITIADGEVTNKKIAR